MNRSIYLVPLFLLNFMLMAFVPGTGSLSGRITDQHGTSLAGATVYIPDLKLGVVTDTAGYYKFSSLPSGRYLMEVHSIGFKTFTRTVTVSGPVVQDFSLSDEYVEESPVVVTGLSKATQIKRSPVPIVAINHDYLISNLSTNAIDAISKIPGIRAVTTVPMFPSLLSGAWAITGSLRCMTASGRRGSNGEMSMASRWISMEWRGWK
jgi:hypothetical protein